VIVTVDRVDVPPWSTMGYGYGVTDEGYRVEFGGDHRPMRHLQEALADGPLTVDIETYQIIKYAAPLSPSQTDGEVIER